MIGRIFLFGVLVFLPVDSSSSGQEADQDSSKKSDYLVVSFLQPDDDYEAAAKRLVEIRKARLVRADVAKPELLLKELQLAKPRHVAFVVRPEKLDLSLARQILTVATQIDDDPFVDFAYGFITGRTAEAAVKLAEAGFKAEKTGRQPQLAIAGVAGNQVKKSKTNNQVLRVSGLKLKAQWSNVIQPSVNDGKRDLEFIDKILNGLEEKNLFVLAGHGYPDRVVGGPNWEDMIDRKYEGAVAYNIACYTGVTSKWYEADWSTGNLASKIVKAEESFCLRMIDTGVAAYVGYACPRPAGPEMFADVVQLVSQQISVGEQRRRHANAVILTHLGQGFDAVVAEPVIAGAAFDQKRGVDEIVREMSTGSLLFGDPAFVPFVGDAESKKTSTSQQPSVTVISKNEWKVIQKYEGSLWHWQCGDQLEQPKMRFLTQIPYEDNDVESVAVTKSPFGKGEDPIRVNAAVEVHEGKKFLNIKAVFDRPAAGKMRWLFLGTQIEFTVESDPSKSRKRFSSNAVQSIGN